MDPREQSPHADTPNPAGTTPSAQAPLFSGVAKALGIVFVVAFAGLMIFLGTLMVGFMSATGAATNLCERMQPGATEAEFRAAIDLDDQLHLQRPDAQVYGSWPGSVSAIAAVSGQMTAINECAGFFDADGILLGTQFTVVD